MFSVSLALQPGANTLTLVVPGEHTINLQDLADLLGQALGAKPEQIGSKGGLWFWLIGEARPVSMRVLPPTPERMAWYQELGSPIGPEPQFVSVSLDWRGTPSRADWSSDIWVAPPGSKAVRGAANWPDYRTVAEYRSWLGDVKTAETVSAVATALDNASEAAGKAGRSLLNDLKTPALVLGVGWIAYVTRHLWWPKE